MQEPSFERYLDRYTDQEESLHRFVTTITVVGNILGGDSVTAGEAAEDEVMRGIDTDYLDLLGLEVEVETHADELGADD